MAYACYHLEGFRSVNNNIELTNNLTKSNDNKTTKVLLFFFVSMLG